MVEPEDQPHLPAIVILEYPKISNTLSCKSAQQIQSKRLNYSRAATFQIRSGMPVIYDIRLPRQERRLVEKQLRG